MTGHSYDCGRLLLFRWDGPLDGHGPTPAQVAAQSRVCAARNVLLDATHTPYADSDGLRWLLRLQDHLQAQGKGLRIAARRGSKVWRNLILLGAGLEVFESVRAAWKAPSPRIVAAAPVGQPQ
jgi:ABC-type transporter Mla MlaB component